MPRPPPAPRLALRQIAADDYTVIDDGHPVGRIRLARERCHQTLNGLWMWNVTIPAPGGGSGTAPGMEAAKQAFRESWLPFKAAIGAERLAKALDLAQQAARGRDSY